MLSADFGNAINYCVDNFVCRPKQLIYNLPAPISNADGLGTFSQDLSAQVETEQSRFGSQSVVADYVDDFQTPNSPAGWQYLWNQSGEFGVTSAYSTMTWDTWRYRPAAAEFPYLGPTYGHPGPGVDDSASGGIERFSIAAYTVSESGFYSINDSFITRDGEFGDGVEVSVHVNNGSVVNLLQVAPKASGNFDTELGELQAGDTIYVGVGPNGPLAGSGIGNDGYAWDFSIVLGNVNDGVPVTVSVDLETQRYLGDVSELDRDKFFNFHSGGGNDQQLNAFQTEYDVGLGRQFWGALPYAKNQTGQVGVYPNVTPSSDQTVRPTYRLVQTGHPRDALRYNTDLEAAAEWVTTYYTTVVDEVPQFYEPMNEPFVHAGDSEFQDAPSQEAMRLKMAELYAAIGAAVDQTPALANMNVVGYASAWPSMELWDFGHWDSRMKMFMDVAGDYMDAFSVHLYDGVNVTGQNNRRVGSNSEAILDLVETYSYSKWGVVKPHALTEFGGIEQGFGDTYSDIKSAQSIRAINHFLFNFLEREEDVLISVPFITDKSEWFLQPGNCEPYGGALWRLENPNLSNCSGNYVYTWRVNFFELWKDVKGERGLIKTSDPDVQAQLFVDGSTAYVAVNNLADVPHAVDLDFISDLSGLQSVEVRQMEIPVNASLNPTYTETVQANSPDDITLNSGGTAVLVYNFDAPFEFTKTIRAQKYYTSQHLQPISANNTMTFNFDGVQTATEGEATLRMGIGRDHNRSKSPDIRVNGTLVDVPNDWKGYDQANRDDFFGVIEIPVAIELLSANNTVEVTFTDSGGRVSSMVMSVEGYDVVPAVTDAFVNAGEMQRIDVNELNLTFSGLVNIGPNAFDLIQRSDLSGVTGTTVNTSYTSQIVDGNTLVTLTFDNLTRNSSGSLIDGNYQLTVNANSVTSSTGVAMQNDFIFGDTEEDEFFAFFGDLDGNRTVDKPEFVNFFDSYNSVYKDARYDALFDYDADEKIDSVDLMRMRERYRMSLEFV